eukprot:COSAG06_NODE_2486_length_6776_cov_5.224652_8_plen_118_part_00
MQVTLDVVIAELVVAFAQAGKRYAQQPLDADHTGASSSSSSTGGGGGGVGGVVRPRRREKGQGVILERDLRRPAQGAHGGLAPVGGLEACFRGGENALLSHFDTKTDQFTKTGSGQT